MAEMAVGPLTQLVKDRDESDVTARCEFTLRRSCTINTASKHSLESFVFLNPVRTLLCQSVSEAIYVCVRQQLRP